MAGQIMSTEAGLPAFTEYMAANPMATYWSTWQAASAINQTELAALREELAKVRESHESMRADLIATDIKLTAAEQRNAELHGLLHDISLDDDFPAHWNEAYGIDAALKPTESGASDAERNEDDEALQRRHDQERQEYFNDEQ